MGNTVIRLIRPLKKLLDCESSDRIENYNVNTNGEARDSNVSKGFRIELASQHSAAVGFSSLREACFFRCSSSESNDLSCDVNMCTNDQEIVDFLLASDDQHKIVATIGTAQPSTSFFCYLDTHFGLFISRNSQQFLH
jgi:hypothetical protein